MAIIRPVLQASHMEFPSSGSRSGVSRERVIPYSSFDQTIISCQGSDSGDGNNNPPDSQGGNPQSGAPRPWELFNFLGDWLVDAFRHPDGGGRVAINAVVNSPLPKSSSVGPSSIVRQNVTIGPEVEIGSRVLVEEGSVLGARVKLHDGVGINRNATLGEGVEVDPNIQIPAHVRIPAGAHVRIDGQDRGRRAYFEDSNNKKKYLSDLAANS